MGKAIQEYESRMKWIHRVDETLEAKVPKKVSVYILVHGPENQSRGSHLVDEAFEKMLRYRWKKDKQHVARMIRDETERMRLAAVKEAKEALDG